MKPEQIKQLDPHYADRNEFAASDPMRALHDATIQLNDILDAQGQPVDVNDSVFDYIQQFLTLGDDDEAFLEAYVLPPHDSFTLVGGREDGRVVESRFLVVDARNPYDNQDSTNPNPSTRIRAYFLVFGPTQVPGDPADILPYYVVSDREITGKGTPGETLHHMTSRVFYAPSDGGWPLDISIEPQRITEEAPYEAMAAEMQGAITRLAS